MPPPIPFKGFRQALSGTKPEAIKKLVQQANPRFAARAQQARKGAQLAERRRLASEARRVETQRMAQEKRAAAALAKPPTPIARVAPTETPAQRNRRMSQARGARAEIGALEGRIRTMESNLGAAPYLKKDIAQAQAKLAKARAKLAKLGG